MRAALAAMVTAGLAGSVAGCSPFGGGSFSCTTDPQCGTGTCQPNGLCSFADPACASGQRYGEASGDLSGTCVGDEPVDAPPGADAPDPADAPIDAIVVDAGPPCDLAVQNPETNEGQVGGNGGSGGPTMACTNGGEVVGVAVRMSDGVTTNGGRSALGFVIACAPVTITAAGPIVGTETTTEVMGNGNFGWSPATLTPVTHCPAGWIVAGLEASTGMTQDLFLDVTITCAEMGISGAPTGVTQAIYVAGSLTDANNHDSAACAAGTVARRFETRRGAGFDAISLLCGVPACN